MTLTNYQIAKSLEKDQNVLIRTHAQHAGGGSQEFYGRFVSFTQKSSNYEIKIARKTEGRNLAGKQVYEELNFTNHNIKKIIPC
jgi:hypothetical protein